MNKDQAEAVKRLAQGYAMGRRVCEHGQDSKQIVQIFHTLCLMLVPSLRQDKETRDQIVQMMLEKNREAKDGQLT